jgi:hypothetical protein
MSAVTHKPQAQPTYAAWLIRVLVGACVLLGVLGSALPAAATTLSWSTQAALPENLAEAQGLSLGNTLYVFGGFYNTRWQATKHAYAYNAADDRWQRLADMPEATTHAAIAADGATIYLLGGYVGNNPGGSTRNVWLYDVAGNTWSRGTPLPADRGGGAAAIVDGKLHFFGGATRRAGSRESTNDKAEHWVLDLRNGGGWQRKANMPNPRNHLAGAALDGKIYALGGQHRENEGTTAQRQVDVYDPATNKWSRAADLPSAAGHLGIHVLDGKLIVVGGSTNGCGSGCASDQVLSYDPASNSWSPLTALPAKRKTPVLGDIGGRLVVAGGGAPNPVNTTYLSSPLSSTPTEVPTDAPLPSETPTEVPTDAPLPSETPTEVPTDAPPPPSEMPTEAPTDAPPSETTAPAETMSPNDTL